MFDLLLWIAGILLFSIVSGLASYLIDKWVTAFTK